MSSTRLEVLRAVVQLIQLALSGVEVVGPDDEESRTRRVDAVGICIVGAGDPGEPEVDLGILTYWYDHAIPIELTVTRTSGRSAEDQIDEMLGQIGAAIAADRTLGGLCIWMEPTAATTSDVIVLNADRDVPGGRPPRGADFALVATYGSPSPLT
jgi:hypothetical protein